MFEYTKRQLLIDKRKEMGEKQVCVAAEIGISPSQYGRIELGYTKPAPRVADLLIQHFDLPTNYFET